MRALQDKPPARRHKARRRTALFVATLTLIPAGVGQAAWSALAMEPRVGRLFFTGILALATYALLAMLGWFLFARPSSTSNGR